MSLDTKLKRLFGRGCGEYALLADGDRVLVAVSGGKDSMALTHLLAQQAQLHKPRIQVEAAHVVMDNIPYETDAEYLHQFCSEHGIRLHILHTSFDPTTDHRHTPCFLCAWHRRKALFSFAAELGFNKVALGHHQDDVLTTMLMSLTYEGAFSAMPASLPMEHYPLTLIRPLLLVPENLIKEWAEEHGIRKQKHNCPYERTTRRTDLHRILQQLEALNPEVRYSMWRAMGNIKSEYLPKKQ